MIVIDASAVLELLLQTPAAETVAERVFAAGETLHAPHLLDAEVAQVVRRYWLSGEVSDGRGRQSLDDLRRMPIERYGHEILLPRMWELRANATAYDATYLALAEALAAPLVTRDARLGSVPGCRARVEVL